MSIRAALCIDDAIRLEPATIGLDGEDFDGQRWLSVFLSGAEARAAVAEDGTLDRVWIVSCEDVEPINLAATLKSDRPDLDVCLVQEDAGGSVLSRAHNASIDEVMDTSAFVRKYCELKGRNAAAANEPSPPVGETSAKMVEAPSSEETAPFEARVVTAARQERGQHTLTAQQLEKPRVSRIATMQLDTFVLPIVSGSGGAGKSTVSVVGAHLAHAMGYRTLLLDYDLQFGDAALLSGVADPIAIDDAFSHPDLVDREIGLGGGPIVLAAPERLESAELVVRALPEHFDSLACKFDVVIANTGAAWAEQHAALLERSNAALFLVDQRASSIRACRHALELCARCGIATGPFQFALNRCAKGARLTSIDVSCALRGVPVFELKDGGPDVEELLGAGSPQALLETRNDFSASLEQLLTKLLPDGEGRGALLSSASPTQIVRDGRHRGRHAGRRWGKGRS